VLTQYSVAQVATQSREAELDFKVFVVTAEGGMTVGSPDITRKFNGIGKRSLEYYLPNTGNGNFGFRIFDQQIYFRKNPPPNSGILQTNLNEIDMYGAECVFVSLGRRIPLSISEFQNL